MPVLADDVPSFDELIWPTLCALRSMGGSAANEELLAKVIEVAGISDETASAMHKDDRRTKLSYNHAWTKSYLTRAGALTNSARGVWALTEAGERMTEVEASKVPTAVRRQDYERRRIIPSVDNDRAEELTDSGTNDWKRDLVNAMQAISPAGFERLAQRLLRESGFIKVEVTGRSGDGGIDGVGVLRLNLLSFSTLFQCKRYVGTVGAGAVRDFRGAMVGRSDKGLIITTGTFSADARREATRDGAPTIELIDGDQLCELLQSLKLGVETKLVEHMTVDHEWFRQL